MERQILHLGFKKTTKNVRASRARFKRKRLVVVDNLESLVMARKKKRTVKSKGKAILVLPS